MTLLTIVSEPTGTKKCGSVTTSLPGSVVTLTSTFDSRRAADMLFSELPSSVR